MFKGNIHEQNRNGGKKSLLLFAACICLLWGGKVYSENMSGILLQDYSNNEAKYREAVAWMNLDMMSKGENKRRGAEPVVILLRIREGNPGTEWFSEDYKPYKMIAGPEGRYTLLFSERRAAEAALDALQNRTEVIYAELDQEIVACEDGTGIDFYLNNYDKTYTFHSHGAEKMGFADFLEWTSRCEVRAVTVAVLDSGVFMHSYYSSRISRSGYDYVDADNDPTNDLTGHGTHVTGIIADCTQGLPVFFYPIRILDGGGNGKLSNLVNAIYEARDAGVRVINLSLTTTLESEALHDAIRSAKDHGICVVAAAGNNGSDVSGICPSHLSDAGVIIVGNAEGNINAWSRASSSNYGNAVDVYAFGTGISSCSRSGGYVAMSGTSMAAPHVTGACAGLLTVHPGLSPMEVEGQIRTAAVTGVPDMTLLVPRDMNCRISRLLLNTGSEIKLPIYAYPRSSGEIISWYSATENIVQTDQDGHVLPCISGRTEIIGRCAGLPDIHIEVIVREGNARTISLPTCVSLIDEEAFCGDLSIQEVIIKDGTEEIRSRAFAGCTNLQSILIESDMTVIADDAFEGDDYVVLIVPENKGMASIIRQSEWQYIIAEEERE